MTDDTKIKRISNLRDQSFEQAYQVHDVGTALVRSRLREHNLQAFKHGDDRRDQDVYSGTGVDLGIQHSGETCGYIEVKTKQSHEWLGRLNKSDWIEYRGFATYVDVPVYVFFCLVEDVETATVGHRYFVRVPPMDEDNVAVQLPFRSKGHDIMSVESPELGWPTVVGACIDHLHGDDDT